MNQHKNDNTVNWKNRQSPNRHVLYFLKPDYLCHGRVRYHSCTRFLRKWSPSWTNSAVHLRYQDPVQWEGQGTGGGQVDGRGCGREGGGQLQAPASLRLVSGGLPFSDSNCCSQQPGFTKKRLMEGIPFEIRRPFLSSSNTVCISSVHNGMFYEFTMKYVNASVFF